MWTKTLAKIGDNTLEMPNPEQHAPYDENCFKQEDRDELKRHGWQLETALCALAEIKATAKENAATAKENLSGLEGRVRSLENFKWVAWGMATIIGILMGYVVQLISAGVGKH